MRQLKLWLGILLLVFFSACGDTLYQVDPNRGFDLWEYMTSVRNYSVEYAIYENGNPTASYSETHRIFGRTYERESAGGKTTLFLSSNSIFMKEEIIENGTTTIQGTDISRYVGLGDINVFRSQNLGVCTVERFYSTFSNKGRTFVNVLMIACTTRSGIQQEFYYGFNEGIVTLYQNNGGFVKEFVKVREEAIF